MANPPAPPQPAGSHPSSGVHLPSPPTSPPAATTAPAATLLAPASNGKSVSTLSPAAAPFFPGRSRPFGRPKPLRWADLVEEECSDVGSPTGSPVSSPASYRDAVLCARNDWEAGPSAAPRPQSPSPRLRSVIVRPARDMPRVRERPQHGRRASECRGGHRRARVSPPDQEG
ncbi:hypothetical protein BS78_02G065800 [Paspalum vaginatum]|nr:hypothetical protein BS78_02G065800 [Paspalum vaginatum]